MNDYEHLRELVQTDLPAEAYKILGGTAHLNLDQILFRLHRVEYELWQEVRAYDIIQEPAISNEMERAAHGTREIADLFVSAGIQPFPIDPVDQIMVETVRTLLAGDPTWRDVYDVRTAKFKGQPLANTPKYSRNGFRWWLLTEMERQLRASMNADTTLRPHEHVVNANDWLEHPLAEFARALRVLEGAALRVEKHNA